MKRKKTIIIVDDKSELLALSRVRRKPETVFLIVPFDLSRQQKQLVAKPARQSLDARRDIA